MPTLTDVSDRHTVIDRREGEYICFPDVICTESGRLVTAYNESDQHIDPGRRVLLVRTSDDNGATWGERQRLKDGNSHCPRLNATENGDLLISDSLAYFHLSQNDGLSWKSQRAYGFRHDMIDKLTRAADGSLLTTGHAHRGSEPLSIIRQAPPEQMIYRSEDDGVTWSAYSIVNQELNLSLCEGSLTRLPDGRFLALLRENSFVYEPMYLCVSSDNGQTWSSPAPTPLIGHRPTIGVTPQHDLLVTYRNVGPDAGTCAWMGTLDDLTHDFCPHGRHAHADNPHLTPDGLRIRNPETTTEVVRYALRPMTDPRFARVVLEAEVRVDEADTNGCGLRLGMWWRIYPDRIEPEEDETEAIPLELNRFNTIRLEYTSGELALFVNGAQVHHTTVDVDDAMTRPILFGAPYPFEENSVDCTWKRVSLHSAESRFQRDYHWDWRFTDGLPDQWVQDTILELKNDRNAAIPDFGYSGWTALPDGSFYCTYHHGDGDQKGYEPLHTSCVMGTRFYRSDFK